MFFLYRSEGARPVVSFPIHRRIFDRIRSVLRRQHIGCLLVRRANRARFRSASPVVICPACRKSTWRTPVFWPCFSPSSLILSHSMRRVLMSSLRRGPMGHSVLHFQRKVIVYVPYIRTVSVRSLGTTTQKKTEYSRCFGNVP